MCWLCLCCACRSTIAYSLCYATFLDFKGLENLYITLHILHYYLFSILFLTLNRCSNTTHFDND
jgi:hypothetical protein